MSQDEVKNLSMQLCPKCGHDRKLDSKKCYNCGIYYEKYEKNNQSKQDAEQIDTEKVELIQKKQQWQQQLKEKKIQRDKWKREIKSKLKESLKPSPRKIKVTLVILLIMWVSILLFVRWKLSDDDFKQEALYLQQITQVNSLINSTGLKCIEMTSTYLTVWRKSIYGPNGRDFETALRTQQLTFDLLRDNSDIKNSKSLIENRLKKLTQPTRRYTDLHQKTIELYGVYSQLYDLTLTPSGSLISYSERIEALTMELAKINNEINVLIPHEK